MVRATILWVLVALHAAGALAQTPGTVYRIKPGDTLSVSVLEDPGLNTGALVRPDGRISMPLAGDIVAEGRTPTEVASAIRRALASTFVAPPTVTVAVTGLGDEPTVDGVFAIGEIANPGRYELDAPVDILQFLALAGGPGPFAATGRIQVRRMVNGQQTVMLFDYDMVTDGLVPSTPIMLRNGDVVVVPQRRLFE